MDTIGCACPSCGWVDSEVKKTVRAEGKTVRVRACHQCGLTFYTKEVVCGQAELKKQSAESNSGI